MTLPGETQTEAWWWPCQCWHERIRHDEKGCANQSTQYDPYRKQPVTVSCICSEYRPTEHPGFWTYDDAQRAHELAQQLQENHDLSSCWCCCDDEGCQALYQYLDREDEDA